MTIRGRKIFITVPVDVKLHRDRFVTVFFYGPDLDSLQRRRYRRQSRYDGRGGHLRHGDDLATGQVKPGIRMRRVFDKNLVLGDFRNLVIVCGGPFTIGIQRPRLRRDHLAHVQPDLAEQPRRTQRVVKPGSRR